MAYFPDLTPHTYSAIKPNSVSPNVVNIGWLGGEDDPYPRAETDVPIDWAVRERLLDLVAKPINRYRGWHMCGLCGAGNSWGRGVPGNGEIRIKHNGVTYVAPVMIAHYMEAHGYRPPDVFLEAVLHGEVQTESDWRC